MSTDKSWQARISEAADALGAAFVESISYDHRLYPHDIAGSIAHADMLAAAGLITPADRDAITQGLRAIERDFADGKINLDIAQEDIHMVIEAELIRRIGDPGRRLHTARSRNDQVALDLLLWCRAAAARLDAELLDLCRALVKLAERSLDVVMPAYTHLQRAQPISAAAEALAFATMFDGDRRRLAALLALHVRSPLGSGAIAGSSLKIDPAHTAAALGLGGPPLNSIEATASRDIALDLAYANAVIAMHLSRLAEQWIIYSTTEFSFLAIPDRYTTGSSMMPQKRNPDMLELIRGRCAGVYGSLTALLTMCKGLAIGYQRDLQEDKRHLFASFDTTSASIVMAAAIVDGARYRPDKIAPTLERGFLDATSLAEHLVSRGLPFRTAHQVVGRLVALCEQQGKDALAQLSLSDMQQALHAAGASTPGSASTPGTASTPGAASTPSAAVTLDNSVYTALGSANVVPRYQSPGASGGLPLAEQLDCWKTHLNL